MQGKVSMVIPCYNKVDYIGEMFDSIIAQTWDYIEVVLVNDGSTDGTRDVIAAYESKFHDRGYEVVIIDQDNEGVCAAAKVGLAAITGDYVCCIDADDELDPEYVNAMAGWLEENEEYDYTMCSYSQYEGKGDSKSYRSFIPLIPDENSDTMIFQWILTLIHTPVWMYLVRRDYFDKCKIAEGYYTDTKGSHEPAFAVPLLANRGRLKYIDASLYHFNAGADGHSKPPKDPSGKATEHTFFLNYRTVYTELINISIDKLTISVLDKNKLKELTEFERRVREFQLSDKQEDLSYKEIFSCIDLPNAVEGLIALAIKDDTKNELIDAVKYFLVDEKMSFINLTTSTRTIAYGALGQVASKRMPELKGTIFEPTELWDMMGDNKLVKQPDFDSLTIDDLIIVFPKHPDIMREVKSKAKGATVLWGVDLWRAEIKSGLYRKYYLNALKRIVS